MATRYSTLLQTCPENNPIRLECYALVYCCRALYSTELPPLTASDTSPPGMMPATAPMNAATMLKAGFSPSVLKAPLLQGRQVARRWQ